MSLGQTIREIRKSKNLTQEELALMTDGKLSRSYLSEIELDKAENISAAILLSISNGLGVSEETLFVAAGLKLPAEKIPSKNNSLAQEKTRFFQFIYNSRVLNLEDKQLFVEVINRIFDSIEFKLTRHIP